MSGSAHAACLRTTGGEALALDLARWFGSPTAEDRVLLDLAEPPVLDVGCGPGRHVLELARRGHLALGVEASPQAALIAERRGAPVIERSIFDRVPGAGRWGSALLLDGSIGIGGQPAVLLGRVRDLLRPRGLVLAEVDPPGTAGRRLTVRMEVGGTAGGWFPWATVGADDVGALAGRAGFDAGRPWCAGRRWFVVLRVPGEATPRVGAGT
jgi:SAM-dependent methyltransferase